MRNQRKPRKSFDRMLNDFLKESNSKNKEVSKRNKTKLEGKRNVRKGKGVAEANRRNG